MDSMSKSNNLKLFIVKSNMLKINCLYLIKNIKISKVLFSINGDWFNWSSQKKILLPKIIIIDKIAKVIMKVLWMLRPKDKK